MSISSINPNFRLRLHQERRAELSGRGLHFVFMNLYILYIDSLRIALRIAYIKVMKVRLQKEIKIKVFIYLYIAIPCVSFHYRRLRVLQKTT